MDYSALKESLNMYDSIQVNIFLSHIKSLEKDPKVNWFKVLNKNNCKALFEQVKKTGVYIDGDSVVLSYVGGKTNKLSVSYDYRAYKNRVLHIYPNAIFDLQLMHEGDDFALYKESGDIRYKHIINNPFNENKKIIGAYCYIKTERGQFIETINLDTINKIKATAKTQYIWNKWFGEMVLKTVIKRACKRHLHDLANDIDIIDNANYELGLTSSDIKQIAQQNKTLNINGAQTS